MYIRRNITPIIYELLADFRIVAINGARQSGKTTLCKEIAKELSMDYYTFDIETTRVIAQNNPLPFIKQLSKRPSVIDEIQMAPEVGFAV